MKYVDNKFEIKSGNVVIARSYIGNDGEIEIRVLQGTDRLAVLDKIRSECPIFCQNNVIPENYYPKLFSK